MLTGLISTLISSKLNTSTIRKTTKPILLLPRQHFTISSNDGRFEFSDVLA